jgi:hypothetical protein
MQNENGIFQYDNASTNTAQVVRDALAVLSISIMLFNQYCHTSWLVTISTGVVDHVSLHNLPIFEELICYHSTSGHIIRVPLQTIVAALNSSVSQEISPALRSLLVGMPKN